MKSNAWAPSGVLLLVGLLLATPAWGGTGPVHEQLIDGIGRHFLDLGIRNLKAAPSLEQLYKDLQIGDDPVVAKYRSRIKKKEREAFEKSLAGLPADRRNFYRALVLQPGFDLALDTIKKGDNVRSLLERHCTEPDAGMDQDLDISWVQKLMGGKKGGASQGFRHMEFFYGLIGRASHRAQLYFHLAQKALTFRDESGEYPHRYWAVRFLGWALHYVQDMSTPAHTKMIASWKYFPELKHAIAALKHKPKKGGIKGLFQRLGRIKHLFARVNLNHHKLMEALWEEIQTEDNKDLFEERFGKNPLGYALAGRGKVGKLGLFEQLRDRFLQAKSAKTLARRVARGSRRDARKVVDALLKMTGEDYRTPARPGDPTSILEVINEGKATARKRDAREIAKDLVRRYKAREAAVVKPMEQLFRAVARQNRRVGRAQRRMARLFEGPSGR